jgi:hypothetical protein
VLHDEDGDESDKEKGFVIDDVDNISMGHISQEESKTSVNPQHSHAHGTSSEDLSFTDKTQIH